MKTLLKVAVLFSASLAALPVSAETPDDFCAMDAQSWYEEHSAALEGAWMIHNGTGIMMLGGTPFMPIPPISEPGHIALEEGRLIMTSEVEVGAYELKLWEGEDFDFTPPDGAGAEAIDLTNVGDGTAVDCGINEMPRVHAQAEVADESGTAVVEVLLSVHSSDLMFGVMRGTLNGGEAVAWRTVTVTRSETN